MTPLSSSQNLDSPIPIVDSVTAILFGAIFLWGIVKALKEAKKNKPKWGKGTVFIYAIFLLLPFISVSLLSLWFYKTLIMSLVRLVCYSVAFLFFKKLYWNMLGELSKPSFEYSGGFVILMMSLLSGSVTGVGELIFRGLDWFLR